MSFAAIDEDKWILSQFDEDYIGHAVDVGAYDGIATSNTLLLEHMGWTVLCIEANPDFEWSLPASRKLAESCACGSRDADGIPFYIHDPGPGAFSSLKPIKDNKHYPVGATETFRQVLVPVRTLDTLLRKHQFPKLDALSIDVEGSELDVLDGIDLEKWKPKAIVAEWWDEPGRLTPYLEARGYKFMERRLVNNLYLRSE